MSRSRRANALRNIARHKGFMYCMGFNWKFIVVFGLLLMMCSYLANMAPSDATRSWKRSAVAALESSIRAFATPDASPPMPSESVIREAPRAARRDFPSSAMTAIERGKLHASTSQTPGHTTQTRKRITGHQMKVVGAGNGWRCALCRIQLKSDFQVDHIIPLHLGGSHSIDNFQPLCPSCHGKKNSREQQRVRQ